MPNDRSLTQQQGSKMFVIRHSALFRHSDFGIRH